MIRTPYKQGQGRVPPGAQQTSEEWIRNAAIKAIQNELLSAHGIDPGPVDGIFGTRTARAVVVFQQRVRLIGDAIVGPKTCRALWHGRVALHEIAHQIPNTLLCGLIALESAFDPGATGGVNPDDCGIAQINLDTELHVTRAQAFDPVFAIPWAASRMKAAFLHYQNASHGADPWDVAVAQHNSPLWAQQWARTGSAPNTWIQEYVDKVKAGC